MDGSKYIAIDLKKKEEERFARFMQVTTDALKKDARQNAEYYGKQNGEKLEGVVLDKMRSFASTFDISPNDIRPTLKQHFPDILFGNRFGVEVKSTKEHSWVSTGSSIVESLREEQVKKVYLLFGRLSFPDIDFRCKPYEECLYDISVTHSPRYLINMDLKNCSQTIFGKMQVNYDTFRESGNQIELVREYYREKFRASGKKGEMPWWIGSDSNLSTAPFPALQQSESIRMWDIIDRPTQEWLKACAYILFPEILGNDNTKYQNLALWLCSRYSIISSSLRDKFSAGGRGNIYIDGTLKWTNKPKVICNLLVQMDTIRNVFKNHSYPYEDIRYCSNYFRPNVDLFESWKQSMNHYIEGHGIKIEDILHLKFLQCTSNVDFYTEQMD
ncbi:MAG: hypothetical protein IJV33_08505 [Bacteroidaceae bacterium]|nr:hypothetical protein [Bacteroidaceae bacterium]